MHSPRTRVVRFFTTAFPESNPARKAEYVECLRRNMGCGALDEICVLVEGAVDFLPQSEKLRTRSIQRRPTYADYFQWINEVSASDDVSLVANADIFVDNRADIFRSIDFENCAFALARWEFSATGAPQINDRNDSQDLWVFNGPVTKVHGDFEIGVPRCDNRMASELERAGYRVMNPSYSIRCFHLHAGVRDEYPGELAGGVEPPYTYIWPHNLWSLPRTVAHNIRHPAAKLGWRLDRRLWSRRLKLHWLERGWSVASAPVRALRRS